MFPNYYILAGCHKLYNVSVGQVSHCKILFQNNYYIKILFLSTKLTIYKQAGQKQQQKQDNKNCKLGYLRLYVGDCQFVTVIVARHQRSKRPVTHTPCFVAVLKPLDHSTPHM